MGSLQPRELGARLGGVRTVFIGKAFPEPHSSSHIEDGVARGMATTPDALAATVLARGDADVGETAARLRGLAAMIDCPSLVIHGDDDRIAPLHRGRTLAEVLDARLVVLRGAGHVPQARHPGVVNQLITEFAEPLAPARTGRPRTGRHVAGMLRELL